MVLVHGTDDAEDTMGTSTLKHHRKSDNRYVFGFGVQTITVTRRFLPSRAVRVRVTSATLSGKGEGNWSEYRDYTDMHEGDAAYSKQASAFCSKWEARYLTPKKETPMTDEPTQEPTHPATPDTDPQPTATQWAGGATMTPSRAAELATRRTGVQHVVGDDGRTLCRVPADAPVIPTSRLLRKLAALPEHRDTEGKVVGRVLGEWSVKIPGRGMGRTDAMLMLLKAQEAHIKAADLCAHGVRSGIVKDPEQAATVSVHATYFRALRDAGYAADTTWDELIEMLRPIVSTALHGLDDQRAALPRVNRTGQLSIQRSIDAAEAFLTACAPVLSFFKDEEGDDD
jgi:hypothetical protein